MSFAFSLPQRDPQRGYDHVNLLARAGVSTDDPPGEHVHDERDLDELCPCADVGEIRGPYPVRCLRGEVAVQ